MRCLLFTVISWIIFVGVVSAGATSSTKSRSRPRIIFIETEIQGIFRTIVITIILILEV